jgi:hypothetical protein
LRLRRTSSSARNASGSSSGTASVMAVSGWVSTSRGASDEIGDSTHASNLAFWVSNSAWLSTPWSRRLPSLLSSSAVLDVPAADWM